MVRLFDCCNVLRVTRDRSMDEGKRGNTLFIEKNIATPDALRKCIQARQTEVKISIADLMELGRPPSGDVYKAPASFIVFQVDATQALKELCDQDSTTLTRIPILAGWMTSQFKNIVQFHNPSDARMAGSSVTRFLNRTDEHTNLFADVRNFLMGGIKSMAFEAFDTIGKPPRELWPGNEIIWARYRCDYHGDPAKIEKILQEQGYSFEMPAKS